MISNVINFSAKDNELLQISNSSLKKRSKTTKSETETLKTDSPQTMMVLNNCNVTINYNK